MRRWKCISVNTGNENCFSVGKVYETDKNGYKAVLDNGYILKNLSIPGEMESFSDLRFLEIKDFTKSDLQEGDIIVCRNSFRLVYFNKKFMDGNMVNTELTRYEDNLIRRTFPNKMPEFDVMQIYRNNELIFERIEKTEKQIELEKLKGNIKELEKRIEEMEKENL